MEQKDVNTNKNIVCILTEQLRRIYRYQRVNQIPNIEEEQTTQWPKEKKTNNDLQNIDIKLNIE
jgi:hypothetical protein